MRFPRTALASVLAFAVGTAALSVATRGFSAFTAETARRVAVNRHPVPVPPVVLENQAGTRFRLAALRGKWLIVDFIYTRCASLCSVLGGDFTRLEVMLAKPIAADQVRLLSISFDPEGDAPADLAAYLSRFRGSSPGWQIARPVDTAGLKTLERSFGITVIPDGSGGYTHNAAILLVDPRGRLVEILDWGDPERAAREIRGKLEG